MRSAFERRWTVLLALALAGGCSSGSDDGSQAQIRLVNVSPGYQSLDLYANESGEDDEVRTSGVGYETASDYVSLESDTYVVKFKRNGVTSTLLTLSNENLTDDSHATYIAYGSNGRFGTIKLNEDVAEADDGKTAVQLVNTAEAGALDVYFTDDDVNLPDATPQFASISSGGAASAMSIVSGTYRLRVTGAGDTDDLRLDLPSVTLESKQVVTYVLTATQGGVLVNAAAIPQQGSLTVSHNTKARVRGANGIANGTAALATIGGVTVLNNVGVGVIGRGYSQVDAGDVAIAVSVDGVAASVPNESLTAGGDYTLLVWSNTSGTQTSLIADDNRLPSTTGKAKVRLLNGMSGLTDPITLAIDFFPTAEFIDLGTVSDYTEVDSAAESALEVTNANTTADLLVRSGVSFVDGAVYTLFMSGGGTASVGGTIRRDR